MHGREFDVQFEDNAFRPLNALDRALHRMFFGETVQVPRQRHHAIPDLDADAGYVDGRIPCKFVGDIGLKLTIRFRVKSLPIKSIAPQCGVRGFNIFSPRWTALIFCKSRRFACVAACGV